MNEFLYKLMYDGTLKMWYHPLGTGTFIYGIDKEKVKIM